MEEIINSILNFVKESEGESFCYLKQRSRDKDIIIDEIRDNGGIDFRGNRKGSVGPGLVNKYARHFKDGEAVHSDKDIDGGNSRAVLEGIIAHHPQVVFCKQPRSSGERALPHTKWFDFVVHKPGEIIRRDDLGTNQVDQPEKSDWIAPEWCLAAEAARQLEDDDPPDKDRLYDLLNQTTSRSSEWEEKIDLLRRIQSGENEPQDGETQELERAQWYFDFSRGEYGDWDDYFDGTSPEEGLAEKAILPEGDVEKRNELCKMLDLNTSAVATTGFANSETVTMFVAALEDAGMHIQAEETDEADASS